jgi:hypothetical protein
VLFCALRTLFLIVSLLSHAGHLSWILRSIYWAYSYAHPWEIEKWDGETPFSVPTAIVNVGVDDSSNPPAPIQSSINETTMQSRMEDHSGDMEIDDRQTQQSTALETALIRRPETSTEQTKRSIYIPPSQDPSSSPSFSLQREAVEQFLT